MPRDKDTGVRQNIRLSGPGSRQLGAVARTQYLVIDAASRALKETIRYVGIALLAGATLFGVSNWAKEKLSDSFNHASEQTATQSVAIPVTPITTAPVTPEPKTLEPSLSAQITAAPVAPAAKAFAPVTTAPKTLAPTTSAPERIVPEKIVSPPAAVAKMEKNTKDGPLWGTTIKPSKSFAEALGAPSALDIIKKPIDSVSRIFSGKQSYQRFWTADALIAKAEQHTENDSLLASTISNLFITEGHRDKKTKLFDAHVQCSTGARGLAQIVSSTQLELLYLHKNQLPPWAKKIADDIVAENTGKGMMYYVPGGAKEEEKVLKLAENIDIACILMKAYLRREIPPFEASYRQSLAEEINYLKHQKKPHKEKLAAFERALDAPLTNIHAKIVWTLGKGGGRQLAVAMVNPDAQDQLAKDFVSWRIVKRNPSLFYEYKTNSHGKKYRHAYTVAEAKAHLVDIMGDDPLPASSDLKSDSRLAKNITFTSEFEPS